jgi:aspartyl-tRNA(Asn)/glutamyl-tRNA(Gln) amidotransferase subunit A
MTEPATGLHYLSATDALRLFQSRELSPAELMEAVIARAEAVLDEYDALICPTFAIPALPAEYDTDQPVLVNGVPCDEWWDVMMTLPFNIASRCPVLSIPSGLSRDGVPTGLSVVARTYDDVTAFRVAAAHERTFPGVTPPLH